MIPDNLLDYQYELKAVSDDFYPTKDSNIFLDDINVRIYLGLICLTFFLNLRMRHSSSYPVCCFDLTVFFYQTTIFLFPFFFLLLLLLVVVVVKTNIPDAPVFSTNLGVDAYHV
jgi:hypothetical protein